MRRTTRGRNVQHVAANPIKGTRAKAIKHAPRVPEMKLSYTAVYVRWQDCAAAKRRGWS